jgi:hypothetical protein
MLPTTGKKPTGLSIGGRFRENTRLYGVKLRSEGRASHCMWAPHFRVTASPVDAPGRKATH